MALSHRNGSFIRASLSEPGTSFRGARQREPGISATTLVPEWQLPGGQIKFDSAICEVQYFGEKHIGSHRTQIKSITRAVSSHRGAARDRHERGAGCGGRDDCD